MMAESKHTPGPWKAVSSVSFESGLTYVSVQPEHSDAERDKPLAMANGEFHVCRMSHTAARHRITLYEANARLIAAAPDLLDALKVASMSAGFQYMMSETRELISAAIAKAEDRA